MILDLQPNVKNNFFPGFQVSYLFVLWLDTCPSFEKMVDAATKASVGKIPILKTKAGPRDKEAWVARLKEEYMSLIQYVQNNKESDTDWFRYQVSQQVLDRNLAKNLLKPWFF